MEATKTRNPAWSRDELIQAFDLYMKHRASPPTKGSPEVLEVSKVLSALGKVLGQHSSGTYRNTNGEFMKMMNFRRFDPEYTSDGKKGPDAGQQGGGGVWNLYAHNPSELARVAQFIRDGVAEHQNDEDLTGPDEPDIVESEEGKVATRIHRYRERDRKLVEKAKELALKKHGHLSCVACGFNFSNRYGASGAGIIDVHHTKPVHTMGPGEKTKVADLALLCSNCHRVVHGKRKWLTLDQLRATLKT